MKKLLKNTISLAAFLTLSTVALPALALEVNLPENNTEEILITQRGRRRYRFYRTRCVTVRRTRRWIYQRCWRSICFRRGRRRVRCRVLRRWRRRISRRYPGRRTWRREVPRRYDTKRVYNYSFR